MTTPRRDMRILSDPELTALARGEGPPDVVAVLRRSAANRNTLLLRAALTAADEQGHSAEARALRENFALLAAVQRAAAPVVSRMLATAQVGEWAAYLLRRLQGSADDGLPLAVTSDHLGAIAAAAAIHADVPCEVRVRTRDRAVMLPTLGLAMLGADGTATIRHRSAPTPVTTVELDSTVVTLPAGRHTDAVAWRGLRLLATQAEGRRMVVALDDIDPYRDAAARDQGLRATGRLSAADADSWHEHLHQAWRLLVRHHPEHAESLSSGVACLVPLARDPATGNAASFASPDGFGAIALTAPLSGEGLADSLIHEFQHAKLNSVLGVMALYDGNDDGKLYSPWRDDPRPLVGLLHGAYAYVGVTDFWSRQRLVLDEPTAHFEFARWRSQLLRAVDSLLTSPALTPEGRRWIVDMRDRSRGWLDDPVPNEARLWGEDSAADHYLCWRLRNLVPDERPVTDLVRARISGVPAPFGPAGVPTTVTQGGAPTQSADRLRLVHCLLRDPQRFAAEASDARESGAQAADVAHVRGAFEEAVGLYILDIGRNPGCRDQWAGLALARRRLGHLDAALWSAPEVVRAVHEGLLARGCPGDPLDLARWLADGAAPTPATAGARSDGGAGIVGVDVLRD